MTKKLGEIRAEVAALKAAWLDIIRAKRPGNDIDAALDAYHGRLALLEGAEAQGSGEGEEVELPDEKAASIVEIEELRGIITKSVSEILDDRLPETLRKQVTEDGIRTIVDAALRRHRIAEGKSRDEAAVKAVVAEVVDGQMRALRIASKFSHDTGDAANSDAGDAVEKRHTIEVPYALTKGNLPLHYKQLLNVLLRRPMNEGVDEQTVARGGRLGDNMFLAAKTMGVKTLTTTTFGSGAEWVPRDLGSELLRRLYLESPIAAAMLANEIDMPTDPFDLPLSTTRPTFFRNVAQDEAPTQVTVAGTARATLASTKLMARVQYSYEMSEDAIIPLLPMLQTLLGEAAAQALERAIINGDTTATHMDSDINMIANDAARCWMGLRRLANNVAALKIDLATGGINRANLIALKKRLGKWGRRPADLLWIVGPHGENDFLNLDEVVTVDKRGAGATTLTGSINSYLGIGIAVSEEAREDLNATGVFGGAVNTRGSVLLVNLRQFLLGSRRSFTLEVDRDILTQTNRIVASFRKAFQPVETPSATNRTVALGFNYLA